MSIQSYKDLIVWQKSIDLVEAIYKSTQLFPKHEVYGLSSQMRRAAVSVPSNIAEGASRETTREYLRYLSIAYASLAELETQVIVATRLTYIIQKDPHMLLDLINEIARMLNGLQRKLTESLTTDHRPLATT